MVCAQPGVVFFCGDGGFDECPLEPLVALPGNMTMIEHTAGSVGRGHQSGIGCQFFYGFKTLDARQFREDSNTACVVVESFIKFATDSALFDKVAMTHLAGLLIDTCCKSILLMNIKTYILHRGTSLLNIYNGL